MIRESLVSRLERIAKKHKIEAALDLMISEARECIYLFYGEADAPSEIGGSRLGGDPDLPPSIEWPKGYTKEWPEYALANFIAQIRFSDLPKIEDFPLPSEGHLWLFLTSVPDRGPDLGFTTFFQRSPESLQPRRQTEYVEWPLGEAVGPCPLRFEVGVTLPFGSVAFREALAEIIGERKVSWDDIAEALGPEDVDGQIGGFVVSYGGDDPARTSALHRLGRLDLANQQNCYTWNTIAELEHSWRGCQVTFRMMNSWPNGKRRSIHIARALHGSSSTFRKSSRGGC